MNRFTLLRRRAVLVLGLSMLGSVALAKSVPAEPGLPVVELMPLVIQHEADWRLSADQIQAMADDRKQALPGRLSVQKKIHTLRADLRLFQSGKPAADHRPV